MTFKTSKKVAANTGISQLAIALAFAGAACSSGGGGGNETIMPPIGQGGASGAMVPVAGGMAMMPPAGGPGPAVGASGASGGAAPAGMGGGTVVAGGGGSMMTMSGAGGGDANPAAGSGGDMGAAGMAGSGDMGAAGMAGGGDDPPIEAGCLADIKPDSFGKAGPFMVTQEREGSVNFWVPKVPDGCKVPVIHLANGTGASCATYAASLTRMASHGFLACCYENPNTGAGSQALMAVKTALTKYPNLADGKRFGSTGHSQGGQATFTGLQLMEAEFGPDAIYAGLAMQPASGFGTQPSGGSWQSVYAKIKGPCFMFSGLGTDGLVSQGWVKQAFDALADTTEAYFWTKSGSTHIPVPNGEEQQISIPWFRWKLLGDNEACKFFKNIPMMDTTWEQQAVQAEVACK